ncbi:MAG: hypothetical protein QXM38_03520 [Candidatus Aenigmatarchaeota archaeon]
MMNKEFSWQRYETTLEILNEVAFSVTELANRIIKRLINLTHTIFSIYSKIMESKSVFKMFRFITFPLHWLWIAVWRWSIRPKEKKIPFDDEGFMIITGIPGAGKSSLAFEIMNRSLALYGKPWYINSKMERPTYNEVEQIYYRNHPMYEFRQFWSDGKMLKRPNNLLFGGMVIEEFHRELNYRESNTREYKDVFVPFMNYLVTVRKSIKRIIALTQMNKVDVQMMNVACHISEVQIDIGFNYPDWLIRTGAFKLQPLGWRIETYTVVNQLSGGYEKGNIRKWYLKSKYTDWDMFDTYAEKDDYNHVPLDYPPKTKKVMVNQ